MKKSSVLCASSPLLWLYSICAKTKLHIHMFYTNYIHELYEAEIATVWKGEDDFYSIPFIKYLDMANSIPTTSGFMVADQDEFI